MLYHRELLEDGEKNRLASYAVLSADSKGRKFEEVKDDFRLCFQKDKERVIHSKAFRRLDEKTQVFTAGSGDHYRTRLTHTLEVAQISRGMARRLGLNEDLAEVIALAHDLGHPPFGHVGEEALDEVMRENGLTFEHNQQSKRIVEFLEKAYPKFSGLNLTIEVLEGLMKHQSAWDQADIDFSVAAHLEAQIVNIGDEIAYTNHDIDDGLRSGLIKLAELEKFEIWQRAKEIVFSHYGSDLEEDILVSRVISSMISMMIEDLCMETDERIEKFGINTVEDARSCKEKIACFSSKMQEMLKALREFLFEEFYMSEKILESALEGKRMIQELYKFYVNNPEKLPADFKYDKAERWEIVVKDYIAGMTDRFLVQSFQAMRD